MLLCSPDLLVYRQTVDMSPVCSFKLYSFLPVCEIDTAVVGAILCHHNLELALKGLQTEAKLKLFEYYYTVAILYE